MLYKHAQIINIMFVLHCNNNNNNNNIHSINQMFKQVSLFTYLLWLASE